jgi:RNA polymerase sigma-70 factor (ECF subfamily)
MEGQDLDTHLMHRLQQGDLTAFEDLISRHRESVVNLAYRFMGDRAEAEDALQEVFLRVFRARERYEPTARFSTWLYRIATNYCLNAVKARRSDRWTSLHAVDGDGEAFLPEIASEREPAPEERAEQTELAEVVRRAVESLPESQRMAIVLNKYHGQSYQEVAEAMELSVMAVKSLLMRARVNLKERLARHLKTDVIEINPRCEGECDARDLRAGC